MLNEFVAPGNNGTGRVNVVILKEDRFSGKRMDSWIVKECVISISSMESESR